MVTLRMDPCIACVDLMLCICIEEGRLVERCIGLDFCIVG